MFKKKPQIKPLAPLRSSDRRRTADQIIKDLDLEQPVTETATDEEKAAATQKKTTLRNSLLPDNSLSARFTTTHGPDLKQVSGTVYVGSHDGEEQRVLWIGLEGKMYPTVYTLWKNPGIVPLLHCGSNVIERLQGGADLMTPGLIGPPFPEKANKGAVVGIAGHTRPTVPIVVGTCEIDVSTLQEVRGAKGHAVETFHWSGDEIWSWSAGGKPGGEPPDHLDGWLEGDEDEDEELEERTGALDLEDKDGGVALPTDSNGTSSKAQELGELAEERDFTQKEIDEAFKKAFLYGVNQFKSTHPKEKNFGLDFPLTQTFVMSTLVNPFLPAYTPNEAAQLQIKKSSWKNIKKFIKSLDKQKIVKSKDRDGNEAVILDIDFEDAEVLDFKPYRLPRKDPAAGATQAPVESNDAGGDSAIGQKLKLVSLYKPKEKLAELFNSAKADARGFFNAADVKAIVTTYVETEQLVLPTNKRMVKLNPFLANSVLEGKTREEKETLARGQIPRDALIDRILASCAPFHLILRNPTTDTDISALKPKAGAPPKIQILLETRSGNKTVTKVSGLEAYFISPQPLADELRKACAGSTSVERLQGSSPKSPVMEVMVQGPQRDAVVKALERRGVDGKRWVEVVDKTKGKKKG